MKILPGLRHPDGDFDLRSYIDRHARKIDGILLEILERVPHDGRLVEAMRYSLMAGGKRLRPILCIAAVHAVGGPAERVLRVASALEMIHTYSLVHDDLPAMDDDELRRGKPTCHIAFDEPTAILAGDALLTLAFEVLAAEGIKELADPAQWLDVLFRIARASGCGGMIEGQMRDIQAEGHTLSGKELESMHALKTGALIEASAVTGAMLGGGDPDQVEQLCGYAGKIGLAYQVADDILNVEGDPAVLGKATGTDVAHRKNTYPSIMGVERSRAFARELVDGALHALGHFDNSADPLRALAMYIVTRKR